MEVSMPLESSDTAPPHTNGGGVHGSVISTANSAGDTSSEYSARQSPNPVVADKAFYDMAPNGVDTSYKFKPQEDKPNEPTHTPMATKPGTSPPTEHKQHLHLPLRKRHLLASSGNHHNEGLADSNHAVTPPAPTSASPSTLAHSQEAESSVPAFNTQLPEAEHQTTTHTTTTHTHHTDHEHSTEHKHPEHAEPPDPPPSESLKHPDHSKPHHPTQIQANLEKADKHTHDLKREQSEEHTYEQQYSGTSPRSSSPSQRPNPPISQSNPQQRVQTLQHPFPHNQPTHSPSPSSPRPSHSNPPPLQLKHPQSPHAQHSGPSHYSQHHQQQHQQHPQHQQQQQHSQHSNPQHPPHPQTSSLHHPQHSKIQSQLSSTSPYRTHSPPRTQSPTHSPSQERGKFSSSGTSNRGRASGRGRGRSKSEGGSTNTSNNSGEELYCYCRRPYDPTVDVFMICCDSCDEWYHGSCVGVNQREAKKIARYVCPRCKKTPTSPTTTSANSSEVSSDDEPASPPIRKTKKRKSEAAFKTEPKRQALSPTADNEVESPPTQEEERYCLNCDKPAFPKSKYCGQECGMVFARKQLPHLGNGNGNANGSSGGVKKPVSATEMADKEALDEIARKKSDIVEKLTRLAKEQQSLEKAIQFAVKMDASPSSRPTSPTNTEDEPSAKNQTASVDASTVTTIDCISCGHPIAADMEKCFHKKENSSQLATGDAATYCNAYDNKTKTYCKKLKHACATHAAKRSANGDGSDSGSPTATVSSKRATPLTCGCPTSDFQSGYCELTRKLCVKHHNWEELMRDSINNQRTQHNKILTGLEAEEHAVRLRMSRRSQTPANSHRTIEEA